MNWFVYKLLQLIRRLLISTSLLLATIFLASSIYFYHYRDQMIERMVCELSKKLEYAIKIKKVGLGIFDSFPKLSLVLNDVVIQYSANDTLPLLKADKVYFSLDIRAFLQGKYIIDELGLEHGMIQWIANQPYPGWLQPANQTIQNDRKASFAMRLTKVQLKDIDVAYLVMHPEGESCYNLKAVNIVANLDFRADQLQTEWQGKAEIYHINHQGKKYETKLPFVLQTKLSYQYASKHFNIHDSHIQSSLGTWIAQGHWSHSVNGLMDITVQGNHIGIPNLLSCLPATYTVHLAPYQIQGKFGFNGQIKKKAGKHNKTHIQGEIILADSQISRQEWDQPVQLSQVKGQLYIPDTQNLSTSSLDWGKQTIMWEGCKLIGHLKIKNLADLNCEYQSQVQLSLCSLAKLWPVDNLRDVGGFLKGSCHLQANIQELLQQQSIEQALKFDAKLTTDGIYFTYNQLPCALEDQPNSFICNEKSLVISNLLGKVGSGGFSLQGTLHNYLNFLRIDTAPVSWEGKLYADYLDLDALIAADQDSADNISKKITIPPNWEGTWLCDIQELRYKRFQCKQVYGKLLIKEQKLIVENLSLGFAGGKVSCNGFVDAHLENLHIYTLAKLQGVDLSRLFYSFNNFQQEFLKDEHLGGSIFADLMLDMYTDSQGYMNWDALKADMSIQLHQAVLRNFAPLQKLSDYVSEQHLSHLRFAALKNHIQIKNKIIHIPPMEIYSNVTRIQLSGTHSFDGQLAYKLVVPLANFKKKELPQEIDHLEEESLAGLNLYLKLVGDSKNYQVSYDQEALKADLKSNLSKQGKILKDIFQGHYVEKKKNKELSPQEYFDFD